MSDLEQFFDMIYGDTEGYVTIVTKTIETGKVDSQRWFHLPEDMEFMQRYVEIRANEDVYCSVGLFSEEERTAADTEALSRAVYADLDACNPDLVRLPPTITVQTSEGHWHAWWILDETVSAHEAAQAARRIYLAHKDQGCDAGWPVGKLLRVPGTSNTKHAEAEPVVASFNDTVYTLDTINAVYADIDLDALITVRSVKTPKPVDHETLLELEQVVAQNNLTTLYTEVPENGDWSERLYRLEMDLFRAGLDAVEVFSLAREAACNKYARDKRSDSDLWKDVLKAEAEYRQQEEAIVDAVPVQKKIIQHEFLTADERRYCQQNPTFIDNYVTWVDSRTDSAATYQYSMAYMLLSCIFSARGYLPLEWGDAELNLWILLLGDTTRTRKSTAKSIMLNIIYEYEQRTGIKIDVGSDATSEALFVELGSRAGTAALQHKDEINGWFGSIYNKQYLSGILETMTELYDGRVPVVLRTGKGNGNRKHTRTSFCFVGVGIRKRTAEVLTKHHFESGFLARMLWSVADPPARKKGSENVRFRNISERESYFKDIDQIVRDLTARVSIWPQDRRTPISMSDEAIERFNQWAEEGMQRVERYGDGEVLIPSFNRMMTSVLKAAALLAMYDQTDTIEIYHLLHALKQAEMWFRDMVRMAGEVASSEFERRLNQVEDFIASGKDRIQSEVAVRQKFSEYRPRDMLEIFEALKASGRIRNVMDKKGFLEALA